MAVLANCLHTVGEDRRFVKWGTKEDDAADFVFDDVALKVFEKRAVLIGKFGIDADMDKLADLFLDRHFLDSFGGKLLGFFGWPKRGADTLVRKVAASAA